MLIPRTSWERLRESNGVVPETLSARVRAPNEAETLRSHSTVLGYQNALRMLLEYLTEPAYGWGELCWDRSGDYPAQVFRG